MKTENSIVDEALSIVSFYEEDKTHPLDNISEVYQFSKDPNTVRDEYERYLTKRKKKGKPITARGIDWKDIIEIYSHKFEELWNNIGLPQNTDEYNSIKEFYLVDVLSLVKEQLFENVY